MEMVWKVYFYYVNFLLLTGVVCTALILLPLWKYIFEFWNRSLASSWSP